MSITAYRITRTKYVATAFDGEGARLYGGRWNSVGTRMTYLAGSRSLATLEVLVHAEDNSTLEGFYSVIPVSFPEDLVLRVEDDELPRNWYSPEPIAETQIYGDTWVMGGRSAILEVPSAVTHEEKNFLVNPAHPDFGRIAIGTATPFRFDPRLK